MWYGRYWSGGRVAGFGISNGRWLENPATGCLSMLLSWARHPPLVTLMALTLVTPAAVCVFEGSVLGFDEMKPAS